MQDDDIVLAVAKRDSSKYLLGINFCITAHAIRTARAAKARFVSSKFTYNVVVNVETVTVLSRKHIALNWEL